VRAALIGELIIGKDSTGSEFGHRQPTPSERRANLA
jgi:hypothetical protein